MTVFRNTCHFTYAKCKFLKDGCAWGWLRDLTDDSREARSVNASFRRSRIHAGSMKIIENGRNMTHMALLGLKLGQNECQRSCEFNAHPPESPKPHKKFKMTDFGPAGERPKKSCKKSYIKLPINRLSGPYVNPLLGNSCITSLRASVRMCLFSFRRLISLGCST